MNVWCFCIELLAFHFFFLHWLLLINKLASFKSYDYRKWKTNYFNQFKIKSHVKLHGAHSSYYGFSYFFFLLKSNWTNNAHNKYPIIPIDSLFERMIQWENHAKLFSHYILLSNNWISSWTETFFFFNQMYVESTDLNRNINIHASFTCRKPKSGEHFVCIFEFSVWKFQVFWWLDFYRRLTVFLNKRITTFNVKLLDRIMHLLCIFFFELM